MIKIDKLVKIYENGNVKAIDNISLSLPEKGMVFIKGKSGSGKTTLMNILGGLDDLTEGTVMLSDTDMSDYNLNQWDVYRNKYMGIVFQNYNLLEELTVYANLELVLDIQKTSDGRSNKEKIAEILDYVDLSGYEKRKVSQLSGGQKQRVAIARAIVKDSQILLADEPTGNLDNENSTAVLELLKKISHTRLVVIITHDIVSAMKYGDRMITLQDGRITEDIDLCSGNSNSLLTVEITQKSGETSSLTGLTLEEAKETVTKHIFCKGNVYGEYEINIKEEKTDNKIDIPAANENKGIAVTPLPMLKQLVLACTYMSKKKFRMALTGLMFSLTLFLVIMACFIFFYDVKQPIADYFQENSTTIVFPQKPCTYFGQINQELEKLVSSGKLINEELHEKFPNNKIFPRVSELTLEYVDEQENSHFYSTTAIIVSKNNVPLQAENIEGRLPVCEEEIAITDFNAYRLAKSNSILEKTVFIDFIPYKVVGIIKTDYSEKRMYEKVYSNSMNTNEAYDYDNIYNVVYLHESFASAQANNYGITLDASDFMSADRQLVYLNSREDFATLSSYINSENFTLVAGRLPEKDNEVIVPLDKAFMHRILFEGEEADFKPVTYKLTDIYADNFEGAYNDCINLYDVFNGEIVVTGVYKANEGATAIEGIYYITDEKLEQIMELYTRYFYMNDYMIEINSDDYITIANVATDAGYRFSQPEFTNLYSLKQLLGNAQAIVIGFLAVISMITLFMLASYISNNIKTNTTKIGVLKALGIRTKDVSMIFIFEVLILNLISFVISCAFVGIAVWGINSFYRVVTECTIDYLYWNIPVCIVIFFIALALQIFASLIPIMQLTKRKPIDIIRSE